MSPYMDTGLAHHPSTSHHSVMHTQTNTHVQIPALLCMSTPRRNRLLPLCCTTTTEAFAFPLSISNARSDTRSEKNETTEPAQAPAPAPHHHQGEKKKAPAKCETRHSSSVHDHHRAPFYLLRHVSALEEEEVSARGKKSARRRQGPRTVCNLCFALDFTTKRYAYLLATA